MSLTTRDLWWLTPLQAIGVLGNAVTFGSSGFQSPLTMPMLRMEKVPAAAAGAQLIWLLHFSEKLFPPMNAIGMFSNLIVGVTGYVYRDSNAAAKAKYPYALVGFVLNACVTGYALGIMAPINRKIKAAAHALQSNPADEKNAKELRKWQATWQTWNYGRGSLMLAAAVVGMFGLLEDGSAAKIPRL